MPSPGPKHFRHRQPCANTSSLALALALKLKEAYGDSEPTADDLQRRLGVSRATAYRYRRAYLDNFVYPARAARMHGGQPQQASA